MKNLWPRFAALFQMDVADPAPISLTETMADKKPLWEEMIHKYKLSPIPYDQVVSWSFGDSVFGMTYDNVFNTIKARHAGFHGCIDTEVMFADFFSKLRENRIIPPL